MQQYYFPYPSMAVFLKHYELIKNETYARWMILDLYVNLYAYCQYEVEITSEGSERFFQRLAILI